MEEKNLTIKDAVESLEKSRGSTVISYISSSTALFDVGDSLILDNNLNEVSEGKKIKKLDLFLHSPGGFLDASYKFLRICREYSEEFNVIIPFFAKSAATIICFGAKEIVMTAISELGPVDPIIQHPSRPEIRIPARSIKDYFDFISNTKKTNIDVDPQTKIILDQNLDPYLIGSYEGALKASKDIIKELLLENEFKDKENQIDKVVYAFTEEHVSHSFPIDRTELKKLGFTNIIRAEDDEELAMSIRTLFNIYTEFMRQNNIIKLQGNRDRNWNTQIIPGPINPPPENLPQSNINFN